MLRRITLALTLVLVVAVTADYPPITVEYAGIKTTFISIRDYELSQAITKGDAAQVEVQLHLGASANGCATFFDTRNGQTGQDRIVPHRITCFGHGDDITLQMFKSFMNHGMVTEGIVCGEDSQEFLQDTIKECYENGKTLNRKTVAFLKKYIKH